MSLLVLLAISLLALAGCEGDDVSPPSTPGGGSLNTLDSRLDHYEQSLRAELEWLWERRNFVVTNSRPTDALCQPQSFGHEPVSITDEQRADDDLGGKLVDRLAYAGALIDQARVQWDRFCSLEASSATTQSLLDSRLGAASVELNRVRDALEKRNR